MEGRDLWEYMAFAFQIVKIQAWEENFRTKLTNLRNIEMLKLRRYYITSAISVSMYSSTPLLVSLSTFGAYTLIGQNHGIRLTLTF